MESDFLIDETEMEELIYFLLDKGSLRNFFSFKKTFLRCSGLKTLKKIRMISLSQRISPKEIFFKEFFPSNKNFQKNIEKNFCQNQFLKKKFPGDD